MTLDRHPSGFEALRIYPASVLSSLSLVREIQRKSDSERQVTSVALLLSAPFHLLAINQPEVKISYFVSFPLSPNLI